MGVEKAARSATSSAPQEFATPPYSSAVTVETVRVKAGGERDTRNLSGRVAVRWPDRARLEVRDGRGAVVGQVVADGRWLWTVGVGEGGRPRYRQEPLGEGVVAAALKRGGLVGPEFADALAGRDPAERFRAEGATINRLAPDAKGTPRAVDGVTVEAYVAVFPAPVAPEAADGEAADTGKRTPSRVVTLAYAASDRRLVRVVSEYRLPDGGTLRRTETHSDVRVGGPLPDSLFAFAPPPGAVRGESRPLPTLPAVSSLPGDAPPVSRREQFQTGSVAVDAVPAGVVPVFRPAGSTGAAAATTFPLAVLPASDAGAGGEVIAPEPGLGVARLGEVSALGEATVRRVFLLKNVSPRAVTLARVGDAAGALAITLKDADGASGPDALQSRPARALPVRLEPGKTLALFARLDLSELPAGPFAKTALVYTGDEPNRPAARLQLTGAIKPLVTFQPANLAFPPVALPNATPDPDSPPLTVVATLDPELWERARASGLERPELVSADPRIVIAPDPDPTGLRENQARFSVSLRPGGMVGPVLVAPRLVPRSPNNRAPDPALFRAYRAAAPLHIYAQVTGAVTASPQGVLFAPRAASAEGNATSSAALNRVVTLKGKPGSLTGAEARSASKHITARLKVSPDGESATLEIALLPAAPAETLETRVAVRLPRSGQLLVIPVAAPAPKH